MGDRFAAASGVTVGDVRAITWVSRLLVITLAAGLLFSSVFAGVAPRIWGVANSWEGRPIELPGFDDLARPSRALDTSGNVIAVFQRQNSKPIELADVPQSVIDAFLAVEDREFYEHNGVNARALFRATVSNVASDANQQGASTITMQVAKNEYLGGFDRDLRYKMLQIHYALMLERQYSKEEILQRYLNTVFFGQNSYGIEAAAETYFGLHARDLSPVQAAFLAGLVQSPSSYNPINNPEAARNRFEQVLGQLVDEAILTQEEADAYQDPNSPTAFQIPARAQSFPDQPRPERTYFSEALTDYLLNRSNILGDSYDERFAALYRGGLTIQTTLNPTYQAYAETAATVLPQNNQGFEAAMVSLDSSTGAVRAMVGGRSFEDSQVNMALAPRQTGSSVKIFILAAALQAGAQATDIIDGRRPCVLPNPGDPSDPFEITDAVSREPDTLAQMTWRSINCAYARLAQIVGLNRVVDTMYRMADSPYLNRNLDPGQRDPLQPFPALATGANEMSPLDMAAGAQTIANNGLHMQPYYVESITDSTNTVVYQHEDPGVQVLDREVALEAVDILKGVLTVGTGRHYPISVPAAGKTGTQDENTNAWFVGFTPNLATAVWVGDPDGHTPMINVPEFDNDRVQGGGYPTEIWQNYMEAASQTEGAADWEAPPAPAREPYRLFLPGNECVYVITGYTGGQPVGAPAVPGQPSGFANPAAPPPTAPPATPAPPAPPVQTTPVQPVYGTVPAGTTIPPDNLDPNAPLPMYPVSSGYVYRAC